MTQPTPSIKWHPSPGDLVEVRTAYDKWVPAIAESGVEGTHVGGRKVHDFPVVWVSLTRRTTSWAAQKGTAVIEAVDLIVKTANPELLDETVQQLGAAVVVNGSFNGTTCRVRCFGNAGYIRFAITNQGYGEVVGEESP